MYEWTGLRQSQCAVGAHVRAVPTSAHSGSNEDFLRRHEVEANLAVTGEGRLVLKSKLIDRIWDTRNLIRAAIHVGTSGGNAAGPDGIRPSDLDLWDIPDVARALHRNRSAYKPDRMRTICIGQKARPIKIGNLLDRIVDRAIQQIVEPFLATRLAGALCRKGMGVTRSLAVIDALIRILQPNGILINDVRAAFDSVPRERLFDSLRGELDDRVIKLIRQLVARPGTSSGKRGIPQGLAIGPMLLNHYLNAQFGRVRARGTVCLYYLDDLIVFPPARETAETTHQRLVATLRAAGLQLKYDQNRAILLPNTPTTLLGFDIRYDDRLHITVSEEAITSFRESLETAANKPDAQSVISSTVKSWLSYLGPAYGSLYSRDAVHIAKSAATAVDYSQLPPDSELAGICRSAWFRWVTIRRETLVCLGRSLTSNRDFARSAFAIDKLIFSPAPAVAAGEGRGRKRHQPTTVINTDGSFDNRSNYGAWAFYVTYGNDLSGSLSAGFIKSGASSFRMEMLAIYFALRSRPDGESIRLICDNKTIIEIVSRRLERYRHWNWRHWTGKGFQAIKYKRLWKKISCQLARLNVSCEHVPSHSGHIRNEICDWAAKAAITWKFDVSENSLTLHAGCDMICIKRQVEGPFIDSSIMSALSKMEADQSPKNTILEQRQDAEVMAE